MAGTISLSLSQQFDALGKPLAGGKLYFYQASTVATPQSAFQDAALTIEWPNPITLDAAGRVPQFFLADGSIKIVLRDSKGVTQVSADNILVIGPSAGDGSSGDSVDPTTVLQTGDLKCRYGTGALTGWVRANGRTIGPASSGATERANSDTEGLFIYLWGADENLTVSGGRGATASADWIAGKTIALPDFRGRVIAGLDDMGGAEAGRLDTATTLGAAQGVKSNTIAKANLPAYDLTVTATGPIKAGGAGGVRGVPSNQSGDIQLVSEGSFTGYSAGRFSLIDNVTVTGTAPTGGSGTAVGNVQPTICTTIYIKL